MAAKSDKDPLNLIEESDGTVLVKFYFQSREAFPEEIPKRDDGHHFIVINGRRQDTGTCVINGHVVGADFVRTGLANTDGHSWKLVNVCWWIQPISNERVREQLGIDKQYVVQLAYRNSPKDEDVWYLPRKVLNAIRDLAKAGSWKVAVWYNGGGPITVNFTSPTDAEPQRYLTVRDGCLRLIQAKEMVKEQPKAAAGASEQPAA